MTTKPTPTKTTSSTTTDKRTTSSSSRTASAAATGTAAPPSAPRKLSRGEALELAAAEAQTALHEAQRAYLAALSKRDQARQALTRYTLERGLA